jgi:hypothetical protein
LFSKITLCGHTLSTSHAQLARCPHISDFASLSSRPYSNEKLIQCAILCVESQDNPKYCVLFCSGSLQQDLTGRFRQTISSRRTQSVNDFINTADGQDIVAVIDEPYQTRYNEDGSFIGLYNRRCHNEVAATGNTSGPLNDNDDVGLSMTREALLS